MDVPDPAAEAETGLRPTCPMCGNQTFTQERGKFDSEWGVTARRVTLLICERCAFVLSFYDGRSIFDFD